MCMGGNSRFPSRSHVDLTPGLYPKKSLLCFLKQLTNTLEGHRCLMCKGEKEGAYILLHTQIWSGCYEYKIEQFTGACAVRKTLKSSLNVKVGWSAILFRNLCNAFLRVSMKSSLNRSTIPFTINFSGNGWDQKQKNDNHLRKHVLDSGVAEGWRWIWGRCGQRPERSSGEQPQLSTYANAQRNPGVFCTNTKIK